MTCALPRVLEAGAAERSTWTAFVAAQPAAEAGHSWTFLDLLRDLVGLRVHRLVAVEGSTWVGLLPLVLQTGIMGRFLTSVPYLTYAGMLSACPRARRALAGAACELAIRECVDRLEIRGRDGSDLPLDRWSDKHAYLLELPSEPAPLWKVLGAKVRSQVRRPLRAGYTARAVGHDGARLFYPVLARRWHQLGSPVLPHAFFEGLADAYGNDLSYVLVESEERAVAAGALLQVGSMVEIPWAASLLAHNRFGVNMLLYWTSIERAIALGAKRFDFGRSTPHTGAARFKLQWGAEERPLLWNVVVRSSSGRASERGSWQRDLMASAWRSLPGRIADRLGPRLAAGIPY